MKKWLIALGGAAACAVGCRRMPQVAPPPARPTVMQCEVRSGPAAPLVLPGSVAVHEHLSLGFRTSGLLRAVRVRAGEHVQRGELLATLDSADADARGILASAAYDKALREARQAESLVGSGALAPTAGEDAQSALASARANLDLARETQRATRLVAPVAGTIFTRVADPGEAIAANAPVVVLDETSRLVVKVGATTRQVDAVRAAASIALLDGAEHTVSKARVVSLPTSADPKTGIYDVELEPDADGTRALRAGDLVSASFDPPAAETSLRVPVAAIVHGSEEDDVFVLDGEAPAIAVHRRRIELGAVDGADFLVRAGLGAGERIVAEGASLLREGQLVDVATE